MCVFACLWVFFVYIVFLFFFSDSDASALPGEGRVTQPLRPFNAFPTNDILVFRVPLRRSCVFLPSVEGFSLYVNSNSKESFWTFNTVG